MDREYNAKFHFLLILEPISGVPPKLSAGNDHKHLSGLMSSDMTVMSCLSQAYPVPVFR